MQVEEEPAAADVRQRSADREYEHDIDGSPNPWFYEMVEVGWNFRASDIHCALGLSQLKKIKRFIARRAELVARYDNALRPLAPLVRPIVRVGGDPAWHLYVALIDFEALGKTRAQIMRALVANPTALMFEVGSYSLFQLDDFGVEETVNYAVLGADVVQRTGLVVVDHGDGQIERFASTGGWTLATKPISELYASLELIPLTAEEQALVEEVAAAVYRPCCDNHTLFPDCNHGMAMLGLLELMASQDASADEMFEAAKYLNAYWFPQQTFETAIYLQRNEKVDFKSANAKLVVSEKFSSAAGASMVHEHLQRKGLLKQAPGQGGSCTN